jgi:hypothetical protein
VAKGSNGRRESICIVQDIAGSLLENKRLLAQMLCYEEESTLAFMPE